MTNAIGKNGAALEPGTILEGRYEVVRLVGEGSFATVYEVRHLALLSRLALKVLNIDLTHDEELRSRFIEEGRIQAQLRHSNIVAVTEIVTDPIAGLVMELVDGHNLERFLRERGGRLQLPELVELMLPILEGVEAAHRKGVIHRDLKPENILIGKDALDRLQPKVGDFGIAKVLDRSTLRSQKRKTQAGARMGTILYMSPEQIRSSDQVDARSDIFSLGAILYELATGRLAFEADNDFDTMARIVAGSFTPPLELVPDLHPLIDRCIRLALAADPAQRFQSCAAFHEELRAALRTGERAAVLEAAQASGPAAAVDASAEAEAQEEGFPSPAFHEESGAEVLVESTVKHSSWTITSDGSSQRRDSEWSSKTATVDERNRVPEPPGDSERPSPPLRPSRPIPPPTWPRLTAAVPRPEGYVDTEIRDAIRLFGYCVAIGIVIGTLILLFL